MTDLSVSWEEYHRHVETLAVKIYQSQWQFNQIVCIAKGGLRVGDILSRLYDLPLAILAAASYGGEDKRSREEIKIGQHLAMTNNKLGNRILLVDDLADSGVSLEKVSQWLQQYGFPIEELRTAVIWYKSCSQFQPDYYVEYLADNPWIHQPFERYETMDIEELIN
ncbi:phosphoribosyltransferase family protein [Crocosphaera sp.]|uniref:phosphoribosyltransferase n=1 Tax=Crocosphaera sp. TaxID=2729996 RepID=UPI00261D47BA|nr:phosphoribosyltransferase family protein [Crocosphaera sp.]MDJ0582480.1 phosphoribosyltransferase family protein [Crocosphaera sp.]